MAGSDRLRKSVVDLQPTGTECAPHDLTGRDLARHWASALCKMRAFEMLALVTPHLQLDSILDLSAELLQTRDLVGLLLDMDRTLKDYGAHALDRPVVDWVQSIRKAGIRPCLLSNAKRERIEPFARELRIPYVAKAFKPLPIGCRAALQTLGLRPEQSAIVGDQLFADVLAGRLAGLFTILVRPTGTAEPWWTRVKRPVERFVLRRVARRTVVLAPKCCGNLDLAASANQTSAADL